MPSFVERVGSLPPRSLKPFRTFILNLAILAGLATGNSHSADADDTRPTYVVDREELELSGIPNVWHLLRTRGGGNIYGINSVTALGGFTTVFLVNGRVVPNVHLGYTLESLPVSAIERIEILPGSRAATIGDRSLGGAINIVLRSDFEGTEIRTGIVRPRQKGGDSDHVSLLWGGSIGDGHLVIGVDRFSDQEVLKADREWSRSEYNRNGPTRYTDAVGVSALGNTVLYLQEGELKSASLGDCTGEGYVPLLNPGRATGTGCGFAYSDIAWHTGSIERDGVFASFEHPLGDDKEFYLDARYARIGAFLRWAPSPDRLLFGPGDTVFETIKDWLDQNSDVDISVSPVIQVGHRFASHGNREWTDTITEHDITLGLRGELAAGIEYDAFVRDYRQTYRELGISLVSGSLARVQIGAEKYDVIDPLSPEDPTTHEASVLASSVVENQTASTIRRSAGITFSGSHLSLLDRQADWSMGFEAEYRDFHNTLDYRDATDNQLQESDVLGDPGLPGVGERRRLSGFSEVTVPVTANWDIALAGRLNNFSDVGTTRTHEVATRYRVNDRLTLRGSASRGEVAPAIYTMNADEFVFNTYIRTSLGRVLVVQSAGGNPRLRPFDTKNTNLGLVTTLGPFEISIDRFRIDHSGQPGVPTAQAIFNRIWSGGGLPDGIAVNFDQPTPRIDSPWVNVRNSTRSGIDTRMHAAWSSGFADYSIDTRWVRVTDSRSGTFGILVEDDLVPRDRLNAIIRARKGNLTASWTVNAVSRLKSGIYDDEYPSWTGHDLALSWRNTFGLDSLVLTGGVLNVTDNGPPILPSAPRQFSTSYDSLLGRTLFLTTKIAW